MVASLHRYKSLMCVRSEGKGRSAAPEALSETRRSKRRKRRAPSLQKAFVLLAGCFWLLSIFFARGDAAAVYENDFEKAEIGKVPADMLVLDGNFVVKADETNKFLELPGAPLDSFSVQFGPAETNSLSVSAVIRSTAKARRVPTFGIGLYGVAGFKLQITPAKRSLELFKDQTLLGSASFEWKSGEWTVVQLWAHLTGSDTWKIEAKAWTQGSQEPRAPTITAEHKAEAPLSGRASIFGSPFAGTPIQFDNLRAEAVKP
jgi:hypothetical protein